jgi:hypothetical protein
MPFDLDKFAAAKMAPRTEKVECEAMREFFAEGDELVWEIRGLTVNELQQCIDAEKKSSNVESLIAAFQKDAGKIDAIREAIGLTQKNTPAETAKRLEMLVFGSVNPKIKLEHAVLVGERFAIEFMYLTNKIQTLTGKGFDMVKPAAASQPMKG